MAIAPVNPQITVQMSAFSQFLATSTTVPVFIAKSFALANFADATPYLTVFDQYRIEELEVWIEPETVGGSFAQITSAIDYDDDTTPSSVNSVMAKQNSLLTSGGTGHYHHFKPRAAMAAYASGTFASFANMPAPWCDSASPGVLHYGLKMASQPTTSGTVTYSLCVRAKVTFRQPGL
jgi:hypothetical protein